MYLMLISSSAVFLYFGTKISFIEDITKLLPQEGPASKSSLVFDDLKVKDMIMLQVTSEGKKGSELAEVSENFVQQLIEADVARAKHDGSSVYIANILSNTTSLLEDNYDKLEEGKEYIKSHIPTFFDESKIEKFDSLLNPEALGEAMRKNNEAITAYYDNGG